MNEDDPGAPNFSILGKLEDFRCGDGKFTMLLRWPVDAPNMANIWRQSSNPVTMDEEGVDDFTPVRVDFDGAQFCGLQKTDHAIRPRAACFINGCNHHHACFYAIGTSDLWNRQIPGPLWDPKIARPSGGGSSCVELYVTTKDVGIEDETAREGNTDLGDPVCIHGKLKGSCNMCKDPLSGHYVVDHNPYFPCTSGHGNRWLWDLSERGPQLKTLRSKRFFDEVEASTERAVRHSKWPLLYNLDFEQTACTGYHNLQLGDRLHFSGWLSNGLPEGMCSLRWSDGSEYHGELLEGEMTGYGRYVFADKSEYRGDFKDAMAVNGMFYPPQEEEARRIVDYSFFGCKPLWSLQGELNQRSYKHLPECPLPCFIPSKADCLALARSVRGQVGPRNLEAGAKVEGPAQHDFDHMTTVTARLIWARPVHADQALWNAANCRGKIVACMRGPRSPAPPCNYSIKLFHCQNAGAVGVIFVDYDSFSSFTYVPRVEDGPIYQGGPILRVQIPCMLTLNKLAGVLQEGALHTMTLANIAPAHLPAGFISTRCSCGEFPFGVFDTPRWSLLPVPFWECCLRVFFLSPLYLRVCLAFAGWKLAFIFCRQQESRRLMSRAEEDKLMEEFFKERRQERAEENGVRQQHKVKTLCVVFQ